MIVPHASDMVRIDARNKEIARAYAQYARRYEEDDEFESRSRSEEHCHPDMPAEVQATFVSVCHAL